MLNLYEESDLLHNPFECFYCDSKYAIFPISPHWHYYMELVFVLKGTVNVHVENKEYIVSEGEMIVLHPKLVHAFYLINNQPVSMAGIKLDINSMTFTSSYSPRLSSIFHLAQKKQELILFFDCTQVGYIQSIWLYADSSWILYTSTTYFMQITLRKLQFAKFIILLLFILTQKAISYRYFLSVPYRRFF